MHEESAVQEEIFVEHKDHVHEPGYSKKDFVALEHVSVANRLTVSRFRNLMSTAAGQKFLNENLHRTALLSSHMAPRRVHAHPESGGVVTLTATGASGVSGAVLSGEGPKPPSAFPLFVRVMAQVLPMDEEPGKDGSLVVEEALPRQAEIEEVELPPVPEEERAPVPEDIAGSLLSALLEDALGAPEIPSLVDSMLEIAQTPCFTQFHPSPPPSPRTLAEPGIEQEETQAVEEEEASEDEQPPGENPWHSPLSLDFDDDFSLPILQQPPKKPDGQAQRKTVFYSGAGTQPQIPETSVPSEGINWDSFKCVGARVLQEYILSTIDEAVGGGVAFAAGRSTDRRIDSPGR